MILWTEMQREKQRQKRDSPSSLRCGVKHLIRSTPGLRADRQYAANDGFIDMSSSAMQRADVIKCTMISWQNRTKT